MTKDESRALADWVAVTGKVVTAIFVTHADGYHDFGPNSLVEALRTTRSSPRRVSWRTWTPSTVRDGSAGFWTRRFPGQISGQHVTAEPLTDGLLELEGQQLRAIEELGHTDTDGTNVLHVPSIGPGVVG